MTVPTPPAWRFAWSANRYGDPQLVATSPDGRQIPYESRDGVDGIRAMWYRPKNIESLLAEGGEAAVYALREALIAGPDADGGQP